MRDNIEDAEIAYDGGDELPEDACFRTYFIDVSMSTGQTHFQAVAVHGNKELRDALIWCINNLYIGPLDAKEYDEE